MVDAPCLFARALFSHLVKGALVAAVKDICVARDVAGGAAEACRTRRGSSSSAHSLCVLQKLLLKARQQAVQTNDLVAVSSCQGTGRLGSR